MTLNRGKARAGAPSMRRLRGEIEFQPAWHHDNGLRSPPVLEQRIAQRVFPCDEQSAVQSALIPHDPGPAAVFADQKQIMRYGRFVGGRFSLFAHGEAPLLV
jgi:hypothetical protein